MFETNLDEIQTYNAGASTVNHHGCFAIPEIGVNRSKIFAGMHSF
jgi:hypothetical protein